MQLLKDSWTQDQKWRIRWSYQKRHVLQLCHDGDLLGITLHSFRETWFIQNLQDSRLYLRCCSRYWVHCRRSQLYLSRYLYLQHWIICHCSTHIFLCHYPCKLGHTTRCHCILWKQDPCANYSSLICRRWRSQLSCQIGSDSFRSEWYSKITVTGTCSVTRRGGRASSRRRWWWYWVK